MLESLSKSVAGRNFICERLLLFVSLQNTITNSSGEFGLDETSTECKVSIFFKTYRSSRPEVFCKKGVLRNFTNFTGKDLCQSLFFNKVAVEHLWWLLLNTAILFNQMQTKIKKIFFNISINIFNKLLTLHAF